MEDASDDGMDEATDTAQCAHDVLSNVNESKFSLEQTFGEMISFERNNDSDILVVLDLANIGWFYGNGTSFSMEGLTKTFEYFSKVSKYCNLVAFIPSSYVRKKPGDGSKGNTKMRTDDLENLESMVQSGNVSVVPAGDSDDAYILNYARSHHGYIISNDMFLDHIRDISNDSIQLSMKVYLNQYRCGYTFVHKEFYPNPASALALMLNNVSAHSKLQPQISSNQTDNSKLHSCVDSAPLAVPLDVTSAPSNAISTDEKTSLTAVLEHIRHSIDLVVPLHMASLHGTNASFDGCKSELSYNRVMTHLLLAQSVAWIKVS